MPRIDKTMLKGLDAEKFLSSDRALVLKEIEVTVLADDILFDRFLLASYGAVADRWLSFRAPGVEFPVTFDQFRRYAYTAMKARVARVRGGKMNFHIRCDDKWVLTAPLAAMLAGLGEVTLEAPQMTIVPRWDSRHDDKIMTMDEFRVYGQIMRNVEADPNAKFVFAHAIPGDKAGDEGLMALVPVRDEAGRIRVLQSRHAIDPTAAIVYLALELDPHAVNGTGPLIEDPMRALGYSMPAYGLDHFVDRLGDASVA
jgi:hypothetical protein